MTAKDFRLIATSLAGASEGEHMAHPDFRVDGKVFATLGYPKRGWGMVRLTPAQQETFVRAHPEAFTPAAGAWGRNGSTLVHLRAVTKAVARKAIVAAWENGTRA